MEGKRLATQDELVVRVSSSAADADADAPSAANNKKSGRKRMLSDPDVDPPEEPLDVKTAEVSLPVVPSFTEFFFPFFRISFTQRPYRFTGSLVGKFYLVLLSFT